MLQFCAVLQLIVNSIILPPKTDCKAKKNGLPHQISGLVRNDIVFETFRSQVAAERIENPVIAKPEGLWRSVLSSGDRRTVPCLGMPAVSRQRTVPCLANCSNVLSLYIHSQRSTRKRLPLIMIQEQSTSIPYYQSRHQTKIDRIQNCKYSDDRQKQF